MANTKFAVVILAAGKGTRMKIDLPKALAPALGKTLIDYVLSETKQFLNKQNFSSHICVVVGHHKEMVETHLGQYSDWNLKVAWQKEQLGTAHALSSAFNDHPELWNSEYTVVACADTPLIEQNIFQQMWHSLSEQNLDGTAATFHATNPFGYGRIVRSGNGFAIREEKDASEFERQIQEVNSGFYIVKTSHLKNVLATIDNKNKSGEFYLTDLFQPNFNVKPCLFESEKPFLGVNTLEQLAVIQNVLLNRKRSSLMASGVQMIMPESIYVEWETTVAAGSVIYPNVSLIGINKIGANVIIEPGAVIKNSIIEDEVEVFAHSSIESAIVRKGASVGPMARLRPDADIGVGAKIGNFVEVKKSKLHAGAKVSHLSYVGDAEIGENSNIGCGFITCNYDGKNKHRTSIGKNTFIGSDCQTIAPVEIGDNAFVAAGSTVTKNVPSGAFAIARSQQITKEGAASRFLKTKKTE